MKKRSAIASLLSGFTKELRAQLNGDGIWEVQVIL